MSFFFFLKRRLINTDLRKCADSSYTKSVLCFVALELQHVAFFGNTGRAAVYEVSDVIFFAFFSFFFCIVLI